MNEDPDRQAAPEPPLNLRVQRVPDRRIGWPRSRAAAVLAGVLTGLLLTPRHSRHHAVPRLTVMLSAALLVAAAAVSARRRRSWDEKLDDRIAESFPASDPGARF